MRLDEKLLFSDFTFGFELEGILNSETAFYDTLRDNYDSEDILDGLKEYLDKVFEVKDISSSGIHVDGSIRTDDYYYGGDEEDVDYDEDEDYEDMDDDQQRAYRMRHFYTERDRGSDYDQPFEYSSAVYNCTPKNLQMIINALGKLVRNDDIYTNPSCGFHTHIHFKDMTERDMIWIYCKMVTDPDFLSTFASLKSGAKEIAKMFYGGWAGFSELKELEDRIKNEKWKQVLDLLSTSKWRAFRIHPQGTLEWRGPRDFLNYGRIDYIKDYFMLFLNLLTHVKDYQDSKTISTNNGNMSRDDFFKNLEASSQRRIGQGDAEFIYDDGSYHGSNSGGSIRYKKERKPSSGRDITRASIIKLLNSFFNNPKKMIGMILNKEDLMREIMGVIYEDSSILVSLKAPSSALFIDKFFETLKTYSMEEQNTVVEILMLLTPIRDYIIDEMINNDMVYLIPKMFLLDKLENIKSITKFVNIIKTMKSSEHSFHHLSKDEMANRLRDILVRLAGAISVNTLPDNMKVLSPLFNSETIDVLTPSVVIVGITRCLFNSNLSTYLKDGLMDTLFGLKDDISKLLKENNFEKQWNNMIFRESIKDKRLYIGLMTRKLNKKEVYVLSYEIPNFLDKLNDLPEYIKNIYLERN